MKLLFYGKDNISNKKAIIELANYERLRAKVLIFFFETQVFEFVCVKKTFSREIC